MTKHKKSSTMNIILFLGSQTISLFGSSLVQYAIMWYITMKTQSGFMMTLSILFGFLPTFFLSPFAGVWADRYNRKFLIIGSDALIAVTTLILAILFLSGNGSVELLFIMSAIRAIGSAIQSPAVSAYLPQMVEEDRLTKVNATNGSIQSFVMLISPMLSGALLTFASIELIFMIDVVTAAIAIVILLFFLKVGAHKKALSNEKVSYYKDLVDGIVYIKNHSFLITFFVFITFLFFFFTPVAFLSPLQVTRTFGNDVWRLTAIEVTFAVGMMIGGAVMATWEGFKNRMKTMGISTISLGVGNLALGVISNFWIYIVVMGLVGIAMPFFHTPMNVILQEKVEEDYMGRVFGVMIMISSVIMPFGMLIFGPLADVIKIEWMLIGTGGLLVMEGLILLKNQTLLKAGE